MHLHCGFGDVEFACDDLVACAASDGGGDLALAGAERRFLTLRVRQEFFFCEARHFRNDEGLCQFRGHVGADDDFAAQCALNAADQLVGLASLEQISARSGAQRSAKVGRLLADGEHQHPAGRGGLPQTFHGVDAANARQMVVEQNDVGLQLRGQSQRFARIAGLADNLHRRGFTEQGHQAATKQRMVVDQQNADVRRHREESRCFVLRVQTLLPGIPAVPR